MATQTLIQPYWIGNTMNATEPLYRGGFGVKEEPYVVETASQTYGVGDLIYFDSSGTLALCTNSGGKSDSAIAGQAIKAASGTTGAQVRFLAIRPDDLFVMNIYHATAASAVGTLAMIGTRKGIFTASSKWHIDITNAVEGSANALARVRILGYPSHAPDGTANVYTDIYALAIVQFVARSSANTGTVAAQDVLQCA